MGFLISTLVGGIVDANKLAKQKRAQNNNSSERVIVNGKYSIDVPSFLSPLKIKNEDASILYGSKSLDISFLVIDEPKSEFIESANAIQIENPSLFDQNQSLLDKMATVVINNMFDIDKVEIRGYNNTVINGLNAIIANVFQKRTFFKDAVYGSLAFIEGKYTLYQINILSGGTSILKLADKLEESIRSFQEL